MNKLLSVSIAAYNAEKYLNKCLDSFMIDGILDKLDIMVIDDGSRDNTAKIAEAYAAEHPDSVRLISKPNGGHGSTINTGIENARGKYFKIVDADDWVNREGFIALVHCLAAADTDLVITDYNKVNPEGKVFEHIKCCKTYNTVLDFEKNYHLIAGQMHAITYRTEILKQMPERMQEHCFYVDQEYRVYPLRFIKSFYALEQDVYMYLYGTEEQSVSVTSYQRRLPQHKRVLDNLIHYYYSNQDVFSPAIKQCVFTQVAALAKKHYMIYFTFKSAEKAELLAYEKELKQNYPEIYRGVSALNANRKAEALFIKLMRAAKFVPYKPAVKMLQKLGFIPCA